MDKEEINFDCDNKTRKTEKQPKKKKAPRGRGKEAKKTEEKLKGFTVEQEKWINDQLTLLFSSGVSHKELKSIAEVVKIHKPNVTNLSREGKRDKRVLKKWYYDNWKEIGEFLFNNLKIFDSDDKMINANAEIEYYKLKKESSIQ